MRPNSDIFPCAMNFMVWLASFCVFSQCLLAYHSKDTSTSKNLRLSEAKANTSSSLPAVRYFDMAAMTKESATASAKLRSKVKDDTVPILWHPQTGGNPPAPPNWGDRNDSLLQAELEGVCLLWNSSCTGNRTAAVENFLGNNGTSHHLIGKPVECFRHGNGSDCTPALKSKYSRVKEWMRSQDCRNAWR